MPAVLEWKMRARGAESRVLFTALLASLVLHLAVLLGLPELIEAQRGTRFPRQLSAHLASAPASTPRTQLPQPGSVTTPAVVKRPAAVAAKPAPPSAPSYVPPAAAVVASAPPAASTASQASKSPANAPAATPEPAIGTAVTIAQYRIALMDVARGLKAYPRIAQENNWQGRVEVRVAIGPGGALASLEVKSGTGHAVLDQHALDMIRSAQPKTALPPILRGREFAFSVPVVFGLKDTD